MVRYNLVRLAFACFTLSTGLAHGAPVEVAATEGPRCVYGFSAQGSEDRAQCLECQVTYLRGGKTVDVMPMEAIESRDVGRVSYGGSEPTLPSGVAFRRDQRLKYYAIQISSEPVTILRLVSRKTGKIIQSRVIGPDQSFGVELSAQLKGKIGTLEYDSVTMSCDVRYPM